MKFPTAIRKPGSAARGLKKFKNPFPEVVAKSAKQQNYERLGLLKFDSNSYHCREYETLVKGLKGTLQEYKNTRDSTTKKQIAEEEFNLWSAYVDHRSQSLAGQFRITTQVEDSFREVFDQARRRKEYTIQGEDVLKFFDLYRQTFKFETAFEPKNLIQMIHPYYGYLMHTPIALSFDDLMKIFKIQLISSFERSLGQTFLAEELAAFSYWQHIDQEGQGYLDLEGFGNVLKFLRFYNLESLEAIREEFAWTLLPLDGELKNMTEEDAIFRFELIRRIFLERDL
mmetsp:Transcript_48843/g.56140  ORF Transcript_48843/g.56140 Transcript_48843/m.56140 type:complete len:284 (+) Transcript_48843:96-947(+)